MTFAASSANAAPPLPADCDRPFATVLQAAPQEAPPLQARAVWLDHRTIRWPGVAASGSFKLYRSAGGAIVARAGERVRGFDSVVTLGSTFVGTMQPFWIALLLLYVLGYTLGIFPTSGGSSTSTPGLNPAFIRDAFQHSVLPALALLIVTPIGWVLDMRNTMIMNLGEDYIRLAKAKGLSDRTVALRYAARNALLPSVTGFALALGGVLGGAILVETVFDYPGLGRLMGEAVNNKDYPLLQALLLLTTTGVLVANLVADLLYGVLDPRARRAEG